MTDVCVMCRVTSINLKVCSECKQTKYCSRECQKKDWKMHKLIYHSSIIDLKKNSKEKESNKFMKNIINSFSNTNMNTELKIKDIEADVFKTFPNIESRIKDGETDNFIKDIIHFSEYATQHEKPLYGWKTKFPSKWCVYEKFGDPWTDISVNAVTSEKNTYENNPNYTYVGELGRFRY